MTHIKQAGTVGLDELLTHEAWVRRVARSLVRGEDAVDEVVQQTWFNALRWPPRDASNLRGWITTVVRNVVRREARSGHRRPTPVDEFPREPEAPASSSRSLEAIELQRRVAEAVLGLKEPYKSVVVLRYYDNLSTAEIARRLGSAPGTVRTQLGRGLARLEQRLDGVYRGTTRVWRVAALGWLEHTPGVPAAARPARRAASAQTSSNFAGAAVATTVGVSLLMIVGVVLELGEAGDDERTAGEPSVQHAAVGSSFVPSSPPPAAVPPVAASSVPQTAPAPAPPQAATTTFETEAPSSVRVATRDEPTWATDPFPPASLRGMLHIPAGRTTIGSSVEDVLAIAKAEGLLLGSTPAHRPRLQMLAAEFPRHVAEVDAFSIDTHEVTNAQWQAYLDATGRQAGEWLVEYGWPGGRMPDGGELLPIANVTLAEVREFLAWCGKRLPTETEWVRAARGDDDRSYPWGPAWRTTAAVYGGHRPLAPQAVGSASGVSPFGVHDLAGNLYEWVDATYTPFEGFEPLRLPAPGTRSGGHTVVPEFDAARAVIKGGCFVSPSSHLRIDSRVGISPDESDAGLGFRAARSAIAGADTIVHAYKRLLPPRIPSVGQLDLEQTFAAEAYSYEEIQEHPILTGYRYLAFVPLKPSRGPGLRSLRRTSPAEPVTVGLLTTSEDLRSPELPAGEYVVAYRAAGRLRRETPPETVDERELPVGQRLHDIESPRDRDVFLFYNVNNAVVGWVPVVQESQLPAQPVSARCSTSGATWSIGFSHDVVGPSVPRFEMELWLERGLR